MRISVDTNNVKLIEKEQIESGEYNATPCIFKFSEEYDGLIKTAVFTNKDKQAYKMLIQNNQCAIPVEVLEKDGKVELGVFGYTEEDRDLELRYSPKPCIFNVTKGSYKEAENSTPPTPTQFEQYEEALGEGLVEVQNVNIDANKLGTTATITITNRSGETKTVQIYDGQKGDTGAQGVPGNPGPAGKDGVDGKDGTNGQDGYTPVRGTDYWTESDIASMEQYCANYIDQNINQAIGGEY